MQLRPSLVGTILKDPYRIISLESLVGAGDREKQFFTIVRTCRRYRFRVPTLNARTCIGNIKNILEARTKFVEFRKRDNDELGLDNIFANYEDKNWG